MERKQLLDQLEDLTALLRAIDRLAPGRVDAELFDYLDHLPASPLSADLLLTALQLQKAADDHSPVTSRRRAV